jgi:tetratricopeptide (TPR) repeat protein
MKTKNVLVILFSVVLFTNCFAQKESKKDKKDKKAGATEVAVPATPEVPAVPEVAVVTEECNINISLFNESAKNKQYADALVPWNAAYKDCPGANKVIYSRGREIVQWELSQAKDDATYKQVFDKLMGMYDNRIKYFGDDARYPTPWILGLKGLDYVQFAKNDETKKPAYEWLKKSVEGMGENSELDVIRIFLTVSNNIFKADATHAENYISDFTKASAVLDQIIAKPELKTNAGAIQLKPALEQLFAQSGAADCNTLDKLYKEQVAQNQTNQDVLTNIVGLYKRVRCIESEVFFSAAVALYKIQPTEESAAALATMSYKKEEFSKAVAFYDEATKLATKAEDKAEYQFTNAQIVYKELNNLSRAREYARNSLEFKSNNGKAYLLIGSMYAKSRGIFDDSVLAKTVYWVAVDKFVKAKQVDPSVADDANELIRTYSAYFPSKDDIFFQPQLKAGSSFFVGGWIGESTTCR